MKANLKKIFFNFYKIPFFDYARENNLYFSQDEQQKISDGILQLRRDEDYDVLQAELEQAIASYLGAKYVCMTGSCTAALVFSLLALDIGPGDEVITVPNTYAATALAITDVGARPVFVDIDETLTMSMEKAAAAITSKTKAILPVHLYGHPCDMDKLISLSKLHRLPVVEDAAQAFGASWRGRKIGGHGQTACFSLHPSKILSGLGNGGFVATDDQGIYRKIKDAQEPRVDPFHRHMVLKSHRTPDKPHPLDMALILGKLNKIDEMAQRRRVISGLYRKGLEDINEIALPKIHDGSGVAYRCFTLCCQRRDPLRLKLRIKGIETRIFYLQPLHLCSLFKELGYKQGDFPVCERASTQSLSLPVSAFLDRHEVEWIIENIRKFYGRG